ncbi:MAG: PEGA domain-containing protein [Deltaproteobacteria bacterium]|nr:PEGA domain-containing protein [Deltaproteobacteria bacterium]
MELKKLIVIILAPLVAFGCMTMRRGPSQVIQIRSEPDGAAVTIEPAAGKFTGPAHVSLRRKSPYTVVVSQAGYKPVSVPVESTIAGETWWRNLVWIHPLFWGIGVIVDLPTGAGYELAPASITVDLKAGAATSAR